jgi:hypothetical protein
MSPIDRILQARTARELFGDGDADASFKKLQRQVHPDLNPDRLADATAAFVKLNEFYKKHGKVESITFVTKKGSWTLGPDVWKSSGVRYRSVEGSTDTWVAYVATTQATGPFTEGHRILENLTKDLLEDDLNNTTTHRYFFPRIMDKFKLGDQRREARALSAEIPNTRWFPLSSWTSMDPRDIAWIARRGLMALDLVHSKGYLHGSPHLEAFIVEPEQHGLMLKDWQYAIRMGETISNVDPNAIKAYPVWVKSVGATNDGKLDIVIFAHAFRELSKMSAAPFWLTDFFDQTFQNPPASAHKVLQQLTDLLDKHWERRFHPMAYPY